jgi:8-oxo-dGTP pyrophosphatase MutT (NUDIX family)/phosphohistidine phosphatase SixA
MAEGTEALLIRAAGAVVWRPGRAGPEIVLVHRPRYDDWSYPKGKSERGEHVLRTAIREVMEETGLGVVLGRALSPSVYPTSAGTKHVSYWAARHVQSFGFTSTDEVDEVVWLPAATAHERLTYERDAAILGDFRSGPAKTVPLILLRHAEAGSKAVVAGDDAAAAAADLARPLEASGEADAKILAALLASYGECQVISSAAERCIETVRPYAEAVGVPIQAEPAFTVTPGQLRDAQLDEGAERVRSLAVSGEPTLICAHRENLPWLMDAAFRALGAGPRPPHQTKPLWKGEFLVLQSAGGELVSAERHDPEKLRGFVWPVSRFGPGMERRATVGGRR